MSGYTKLFSSIVTSTVWCEDHATLRVWIAMLAVVDATGRVEGSVPGFASLARVSIEEMRHAIKVLSSPDRDSRTPEHEGRRIEAVEGGWIVLNYLKYRDVPQGKDGSRAPYFRERRAQQSKVSRNNQDVAHYTEAEAEAEAEASSAATQPHPANCGDVQALMAEQFESEPEPPPKANANWRAKQEPTLSANQPPTAGHPASPPTTATAPPGESLTKTTPVAPELIADRNGAAFERLTAIWESVCVPAGFARAHQTAKQVKAARTRVRDPGWLDAFRAACAYAASEPFYRGGSNSGWCMTFGWLLQAGNAEKTAERAQTRKANGTQPEQRVWLDERNL